MKFIQLNAEEYFQKIKEIPVSKRVAYCAKNFLDRKTAMYHKDNQNQAYELVGMSLTDYEHKRFLASIFSNRERCFNV